MRSENTHPLVIRAESVRLVRAEIEALADDIPSNQEGLDTLLRGCVEGYYARAFTATALAAVHKGVPVDARHLVEGARLLPDPGFIARLAMHVTGDVVEALVGAVADGRLSVQREAVTLFLAAHWSREREDVRHREEIVRRTRMCARRAFSPEVDVFVAAAADILADEELSRLVARLPAGGFLPRVDEWTGPLLEATCRPILEDLAEDEDNPVLPTTRRRAAVRVGRNEPCPCGSGKKYKRCCAARDQERLRDSSDVAGVTRAELRLHLEEHLTRERIHAARAHELAHLDPRRIDPALHGAVLNRLIHFEEFDAVREFFEAVGTDETEGHYWDAVDAAFSAGKPEAARALLEVTPPPDEHWLGLLPRLARADAEASSALDLIESEARPRVDEAAVDLACDLMRSRWPCLGLLVARGVAPLANTWDRDALIEEVGLTRDRLGLTALDPTETMEDLWGSDEEEERFYEPPPPKPADTPSPAASDEAARQTLEKKEEEVKQLRRELSELRRRLDEHEASMPETAPSIATEPAPPDPRVVELKERVSRLRADLSQRHAERNQLRRQLERTLKRLDSLESERARRSDETTVEPAAEDDVDAGSETLVALSFRIPVFSKRFRSSAQTVPDAVRRRAVIVASRIASGDEDAFRGTRRLRANRDLYRQRIGREHRFLFRMHPDELEALDLVPRKELERTIRELS